VVLSESYAVGSLFSGIGGIELGLERTGRFRTAWFCEPTEYAAKILEQHWPGTPNHGWTTNIIDFGKLGRVDVLTGGFPCQPVSMAGKRKAQEDERWMWPEYFRAIREIRPKLALIENVRGLLSAGFYDVLRDLASIGYAAEWQVIPAFAVGAPHRRERVFIVAYPDDSGRVDGQAEVFTTESWEHAQRELITSRTDMADTHGRGRRRKEGSGNDDCERGKNSQSTSDADTRDSRGRGQWYVEPDVGRVANGVSARLDRIKALGNAVVPQVAEAIAIMILRSGVLD
jgi:DNA (cytosine-5)-methyltransferase 1